jgi:hypothetical protein
MAWFGLKAAVGGKWAGLGRRAGEQARSGTQSMATMRRVRRATAVVAAQPLLALALAPMAPAGTGMTAVKGKTIVVVTTQTPAPGSGDVRFVAPVRSASDLPGDWSVSGNGCFPSSSGYTTWCALQLAILVITNGVVTDRVGVRLLVNPGASVSKVSYTATYSPDAGNFSQLHIITYPLCYIQRENCGADDLYSLVLSKSTLLYPRTPSMRGHQLGTAFTLGGFCASCASGHRYADSSYRTGMANCNKTNNNCYYPK